MQANDCQLPRTRQVVAPLLRRDSIGSSHHVLTFEFDEPLQAQPGQFLMVRGAQWGEAPFLPRPMSILSAGKRPSILVKVVGEGTRRLATSEPGELFTVHAPLGRPWTPCSADTTALLVAGGVGVCPLLFFAREVKGANKLVALYGGKSAVDLPLHEEFAEAAELRMSTEDGSRGEKGLVTHLLERALREAAGPLKVYTCGPTRMMARVAAMCRDAGVACEASLETMMGCGYGVCLGCAVPRATSGFLYACSEGPCVDASAINWEQCP